MTPNLLELRSVDITSRNRGRRLLRFLKSPTNKKEAQQLWDFSCSRNNIFLIWLNLSIYKVTRKAINFVWNEEQEKAFQQLKQYVPLFSTLQTTEPGDKIVLDISFLSDHGNWGLY